MVITLLLTPMMLAAAQPVSLVPPMPESTYSHQSQSTTYHGDKAKRFATYQCGTMTGDGGAGYRDTDQRIDN